MMNSQAAVDAQVRTPVDPQDGPCAERPPLMYPAAIRISALLLAGALGASAALGAAPESRQEAIARSGASVMPFDLTRTKHFFDDTAHGGIETITANDARDRKQIGLIREHLALEARRFSNGDFSDPAKIHGEDMPGLSTLAAAKGKLRVTYKKLPAGASLTYASRDKNVVAAVHDWFAAQRSDHNAHEHMHMQMR